MSNWLHITVIGLKVVTGAVLVADSVGSAPALRCLLNGSMMLAPVAWGIATQFVSDN